MGDRAGDGFVTNRFDQDTVAKALEDLADFAEKRGLTFSKFESIGDSLVMLAAPRWEHGDIIDQIKEQVPRHRRCKISTDLQLTAEPREPVPDLIVLPEALRQGSKPWAHETELLVEVVSPSNYRSDYEGKRERYARSNAPQYLLVDPRDGVCVLFSGPKKADGTYERVVTTKFGEPVVGLACMDGGELDTSEFLRYT
ncbi:Uma2 family endonuclease [Actinomadura spongiicola]|nr:Uma2 family endonuclease [Actinomadura spongiicola]